MASINGIQIKSRKSFKGHEGEPLFQGNIYFNKKKLGFWSQDAWSGPDNFDFDLSVLKTAVSNYKESFPDTFQYKAYIDIDHILQDICFLSDIEKQFKKFQKKGCQAMILLADRMQFIYIPVMTDEPDKTMLQHNKEVIETSEKQLQPEHSLMIFRSLNDFNPNFDKQHPVYPIFT